MFRVPVRVAALALSAFVPLGTAAADPAAPAADAIAFRAATAAMHAMQAGALRTIGMEAATNWLAGGRLAQAEAEGWSRMLRGAPGSPDAKGIVLAPVLAEDFLAGASVLLGPCDSRGAVFAFSNPVWDALLFVRTGGGDLPRPGEHDPSPSRSASAPAWAALLDGDDGQDAGPAPEAPFPLRRVPVVEDLRWIDGDSFRGGPPPGAAPDDPFCVRLWRIDAANAERFRALHSDPADFSADPPVRFARAVEEADDPAVAAAIRERAAVRAAELRALASDPVLLRAAALSARLLRTGGEAELRRFFDSPSHAFFCRDLAAFPPEIRGSFVPCGARTGPDGAQALFVALDAPRFFATVSFPAARLSGESRQPVQMEWYDLARSADLLAAWERNRKEAVK